VRILVIDPGSTSTKVGVSEDGRMALRRTITHDRDQIDSLDTLMEQEPMRAAAVSELLADEGYLNRHRTVEPAAGLTAALPGRELSAVVGRGGLIRPVPGGTYVVDREMLEDLKRAAGGVHASNLGAVLARRFADAMGIPAFVVDPVVVDELSPLARLSGLQSIPRRSVFHALNQRAVAREVARRLGNHYSEVNLIVAHLGSGISVGAHERGQVVDVNNALDGDGPYSQERTGGLPVSGVIGLLEAGEGRAAGDLLRTVRREGGLFSYVGESDLQAVEKRIEGGDREAALAVEGMAYQTAKEIGSLAAALRGQVDGIVLTGGCAHSRTLVSEIERRVGFIATVHVIPGELELEALAEGARRVLAGEEEAREYRRWRGSSSAASDAGASSYVGTRDQEARHADR